jgi:hypothetical protein
MTFGGGGGGAVRVTVKTKVLVPLLPSFLVTSSIVRNDAAASAAGPRRAPDATPPRRSLSREAVL